MTTLIFILSKLLILAFSLIGALLFGVALTDWKRLKDDGKNARPAFASLTFFMSITAAMVIVGLALDLIWGIK